MKRKKEPTSDTLVLDNEPESKEELVETPDGAFLSAAEPNKLEELELKPFSLMRQAVAISLGALNDTPEDNFFNAVVIVWLCTLGETGVITAKRFKTSAIAQAFEFGEKRGYSMTNFRPLLDIYEKIMTEINASSKAVLASKDGEGPADPNSGGQPQP